MYNIHEDIIISQMYIINDRHIYDIWFLRYEVQWTEFFVILDHFLPFYPPLTAQNTKILKKLKKFLEILSFYTCVQKIMIR